MSLFPSTIINLIKNCAYWADRSLRSELSLGFIADEHEYTSNFTVELRRHINNKDMKNLRATSLKVNSGMERNSGTDTCIILSNDNKAIMCMFEAKLPRLSTRKDAWDSIEKSTNQSLFSGQLQRQSKYTSYFTIWEMFYCDESFKKQEPPFLDYVSTCIMHDEAISYDSSRPNKHAAWTDSELIDLHNKSSVFTIDELIESVCSCYIGRPVNLKSVNDLLSKQERAMDVLAITYSENRVLFP